MGRQGNTLSKEEKLSCFPVTNAFPQGGSRLSVLAGSARLGKSGFRLRQSGETEFVRAQPDGAVAAVLLGGCVGEVSAGAGGIGAGFRSGAVFHGVARCGECLG